MQSTHIHPDENFVAGFDWKLATSLLVFCYSEKKKYHSMKLKKCFSALTLFEKTTSFFQLTAELNIVSDFSSRRMSTSVSPDVEINTVLPSTQPKTFLKLIKKRALPPRIAVIILCSVVIGAIGAVNLVVFVFFNHEQSSTTTTRATLRNSTMPAT
ncbi:unnamed protein product [Adineta ricciae]|uniref:Uncharacterized protein n=1 Tax=Adineta ricciae TaxID=249248 RepID=A0A814LVU4_ADIRI|nr:unnamed protein product [Adineta ricciae]CAF1069415.1 unnamed protein product [Adineta ricciae]